MLAGGVNRIWRSACGQTLPSNVLCKARQEASASIERLEVQPRTLKIPVLAAPSIGVFGDVLYACIVCHGVSLGCVSRSEN